MDEELQYVSWRVWPNERTLQVFADPRLIHYEAHEPTYGDRLVRDVPDESQWTGNRPYDHFDGTLDRRPHPVGDAGVSLIFASRLPANT